MPAIPPVLRRPGLLFGASLACFVVYEVTLLMHGLPRARTGLARVAYLALYGLTVLAALRAAAAVPAPARDASRAAVAGLRGRVVAWRATALFAASVPTAILLASLLRELGMPAVAATVLDLVAVLVYPAALVAVMALAPPRTTRAQQLQLAVDLTLVMVSALVLAGFFYLHQTAAGLLPASTPSFLYFVLSPIGALAVVFGVTRLILDGDRVVVDAPIVLVVAGIVTSTVADMTAWMPGLSVRGMIAGLWALAILLVNAGAYVERRSPRRAPVREPEARRRTDSLVPFGMPAVVLLVLLAAVPVLSSSAMRFLLYGVIALGLLVLTRQIVTLREVRRLLASQRRQDARFRALVERSGDALIIVASTGRVTYHSPAFDRIFEVEAGAPAGRDLFAIVPPDEHAAVRRLLSAPQAGSIGAVIVRTRAEPPAWVELVASDHTGDPDIAGVVLNVRDVTERRRLQTRLSQAEKLEAVGRLAGGIAHDFNNMLTAIIGYTDLVEQSVTEGTPDVEDVREIRRASLRAAELTRQLMAFGRRQMIAPRRLVVDDVVHGMERMLRRLMPCPIVLETKLDTDGWTVVADPAQVEQVVLNLALNARDAMPRVGRVLVETARVAFRDGGSPRTGGGDAGDAPGGRYVRLRVSDAGEGMTPATMQRLFEPFFTTKIESAGTGLGLATVYGIVKQANGFIGVESTAGVGTVFTVLLPCSPAADVVRPTLPALRDERTLAARAAR